MLVPPNDGTGSITLVVTAASRLGKLSARTCWRMACARMMPAAAWVTVGLFSTARRIASSNVRRSKGTTPCALALIAVTKTTTHTDIKHTEKLRITCLCGLCVSVAGARRLRMRRLFHVAPGPSADSPHRLNDDIQNGNENDVEERGEEHPARHGFADRMPALLARSGRKYERHHPENERQRGHEDRPQPDTRRLDGRFDHRHAAAAQLLGEFNDQDRVLGREADQHDQS